MVHLHQYFEKILEAINSPEAKVYKEASERYLKDKLLSKHQFSNEVSEQALASFMLKINRLARKIPDVKNEPLKFIPAELLNISQCSSEETAIVKKSITQEEKTIIDICSGWGVDAYFLGQDKIYHAIDIDANLYQIREFNFRNHKNITNHIGDGLKLLPKLISSETVVYADPSRRDKNKSKVFKIEDCTPDVSQLPEVCKNKSAKLMLKLSPMIDLNSLQRLWGKYKYSTHLLSLANELKEVLLYFDNKAETVIHHIENKENIRAYTLTETASRKIEEPQENQYLYDANPAFRKLKAQNFLAEKFDVKSTGKLLFSNDLIENFPGRCFKITEELKTDKSLKKRLKGMKLSVISRAENFKAQDIEKKYLLKPDNTQFLIYINVANQKSAKLVLAERVF